MSLEEITMEEAAGRSLLELAREHKDTCPGPDCTVTLFPLGQVYERLVGRELTDEERLAFL